MSMVLLQHRAVIVVRARLVFRLLPLAGDFHRAGEHVFVRIADGNDFDRRDLLEPPQVAFAIPARADQPDAPGSVGGGKSGGDITRRRQRSDGGGAELEEFAAVHGLI